MSHREAAALLATLDAVEPTVSTACAGWTAHDIVAHLAAGSEEIADLLEEKKQGLPVRATRLWEDREPAFRALSPEELRVEWGHRLARKFAGQEWLASLGPDATFDFTGMAMTAAQLATHLRSEAAIHRWDIVGSDELSNELLAQPEFTAHAVAVLNGMPILNESARSRAAGRTPMSILLRAPGYDDVVLEIGEGAARFALLPEGQGSGDAVVDTDAAHRLLILWGRKSSAHEMTVRADESLAETVSSVLWPATIRWR